MVPDFVYVLLMCFAVLVSTQNTKARLNDLNDKLSALKQQITAECFSLPKVPMAPHIDSARYDSRLDLDIGITEAMLRYTRHMYNACDRLTTTTLPPTTPSPKTTAIVITTTDVHNSTEALAIYESINKLEQRLNQVEQKQTLTELGVAHQYKEMTKELGSQNALLAKSHADIDNIRRQTTSLEDTQKRLEQRLLNLPPSLPTVKQFTWPALNDDRDGGIIHSGEYNKKGGSTGLRVAWSGNIGVHIGTKWNGCNRWYFTFNNKECSNPLPIDLLYYTQIYDVPHHPVSVEGVCNGLDAGKVVISLHVGACPAYRMVEPGDAYTGWNSASRLLVEEVEAQ